MCKSMAVDGMYCVECDFHTSDFQEAANHISNHDIQNICEAFNHTMTHIFGLGMLAGIATAGIIFYITLGN